MNNHFKIRITKLVTFRDRAGHVLKEYQPGELLNATADAGHYFVTSMGGIYKTEAELAEGVQA